MIAGTGRADAGAYLARLLRLDPGALVRVKPIGSGVAELWAMLPFGVLVARRVPATVEVDSTVEASALLHTLSDDIPAPVRRRDESWRWPLPPSSGVVVERIPAADVAAIATAASRTLRVAVAEGVGGRRVGERVVRDALLDHVAIVASDPTGLRVEVPQRLVQALVRMGFIQNIDDHVTDGETLVTVRSTGGWIGLDGSYGSVWYRPISPLRFA